VPNESTFAVDDRDPVAPMVSLTGEIDIANTPALTAQLRQLTAPPATGLIVDLTSVSFIDSSGLSALVASWRRLEERGAQLVVVASSPLIVRLLNVTGLNQLFTVVSTPADARAALSGGEG
jgi:anti-sigma B factor antagonist